MTNCLVPLLPKLRGHFAEFLNKGSPVRLRIFFSSTCVGLRYGYLITFSSFSRRCGFICFASLIRSPSRLRLTTRVLHYVPTLPLGRAFPSARSDYPPVSLLPLSLLMPAFSLPYSPPLLPVWLQSVRIAPLPMYFVHSQASVSGLSPVNFRRKITRPVSYYALF